jgi:hypothetical protein
VCVCVCAYVHEKLPPPTTTCIHYIYCIYTAQCKVYIQDPPGVRASHDGRRVGVAAVLAAHNQGSGVSMCSMQYVVFSVYVICACVCVSNLSFTHS